MVDVLVFDSRGGSKQFQGISPHTKLATVFSFERNPEELVFVSSSSARNLCLNSTVADAQSNTIFSLKRINSYGHDLIFPDPEESGSIARMTASTVSAHSK
jgi:hypothetical protein